MGAVNLWFALPALSPPGGRPARLAPGASLPYDPRPLPGGIPSGDGSTFLPSFEEGW
jgi:hypothetical protein